MGTCITMDMDMLLTVNILLLDPQFRLWHTIVNYMGLNITSIQLRITSHPYPPAHHTKQIKLLVLKGRFLHLLLSTFLLFQWIPQNLIQMEQLKEAQMATMNQKRQNQANRIRRWIQASHLVKVLCLVGFLLRATRIQDLGLTECGRLFRGLMVLRIPMGNRDQLQGMLSLLWLHIIAILCPQEIRISAPFLIWWYVAWCNFLLVEMFIRR